MAESTNDPARGASVQNAIPSGSDKPFPWRLVGAGVIGALIITLLVQNGESTQVDLLFIHFSLPLWILLLGVFILGMLLDGLVQGAIRKAMGKGKNPSKK